MENEQEIQNLLRMVIEARTKTQQIEHDIEQARKTQAAIKEANDERIRKIQEESRQLDSELGSKEITLNKEKSEIDTQIWEARAKLLRRLDKGFRREMAQVESQEQQGIRQVL
jgi:hypothetical protein